MDETNSHIYQPGLLLLPFGVYAAEEMVKQRDHFFSKGVNFIQKAIQKIEPTENRVFLADGTVVGYDYLIIASGTTPRPDQTPGMDDPKVWRKSIFDFFTLDGSKALHDALAIWQGGRLVVHITEMPIKCPVAPLEFAFLVDAFFEERKIRLEPDFIARSGLGNDLNYIPVDKQTFLSKKYPNIFLMAMPTAS